MDSLEPWVSVGLGVRLTFCLILTTSPAGCSVGPGSLLGFVDPALTSLLLQGSAQPHPLASTPRAQEPCPGTL